MAITVDNVFSVLVEAMPEFKPNEVNDGLSYPYLNDMVRFVSNRAYPEYELLLRQFAALIERLLTEGDEQVCWLAEDGLDTLCGHEDAAERDMVASHFGTTSRVLWRKVCAGRAI
jgi:hypothetical protein